MVQTTRWKYYPVVEASDRGKPVTVGSPVSLEDNYQGAGKDKIYTHLDGRLRVLSVGGRFATIQQGKVVQCDSLDWKVMKNENVYPSSSIAESAIANYMHQKNTEGRAFAFRRIFVYRDKKDGSIDFQIDWRRRIFWNLEATCQYSGRRRVVLASSNPPATTRRPERTPANTSDTKICLIQSNSPSRILTSVRATRFRRRSIDCRRTDEFS